MRVICKNLTAAAIFSMIGLTLGCGTAYRAAPAIKYTKFGVDERKLSPVHPLDLDTYSFPDQPDKVAIVLATEDRIYRNRLQSTVMLRSNEICDVVHSQILAYSNSSNLATGFFSSLLSGAAAVVTGSALKSQLAAAAGVSTATRSLVNDEVYRGKFVQIILDAMARSRKEKAAIIRTKWGKELTEYSLEESLLDAVEYHALCSFHNGVTLLSAAVDRKTPCDLLREQQKAIIKDIDVYAKLVGENEGSPAEPELLDSEGGEAGEADSSPPEANGGQSESSIQEKYSTYILEARWSQLRDVEIQLSACIGQ